jgi:hypothetical protein
MDNSSSGEKDSIGGAAVKKVTMLPCSKIAGGNVWLITSFSVSGVSDLPFSSCVCFQTVT